MKGKRCDEVKVREPDAMAEGISLVGMMQIFG